MRGKVIGAVAKTGCPNGGGHVTQLVMGTAIGTPFNNNMIEMI
jgi:hypothetical protein